VQLGGIFFLIALAARQHASQQTMYSSVSALGHAVAHPRSGIAADIQWLR